ncbi:MAG: hypothetical protein KBT02_07120 [Treponema sp.]|nr:hypothetical protein [Candidatus Treponema caballi]
MGLLSSLIDFFGSLFLSSKPEGHQRAEIRKIEQDLKVNTPNIYKNRTAMPNMAEAFRQMQVHSKPVCTLLSETLCSENKKISSYYSSLLIETGFSDQLLEKKNRLSYQVRKEEFFAAENPQKVIDNQKRDLEILIKEMGSGFFPQIERTILSLFQLYDVCNYSYVSMLHLFNPDYNGLSEEQVPFNSIPIENIEKFLLDFYFVTGNTSITASMGRALIALATRFNDDAFSDRQAEELLSHLRKMSNILTKVLSPQNQVALLRIIKTDPHYEPRLSVPQKKIMPGYIEQMKRQFTTDSERITSEIQDEQIAKEMKDLFTGKELTPVFGYNQDNNSVFQECGAGSFLWITPVQIIKSFITYFYNESAQSLLNDLVVEGFFNNQQYKTDFSSIVYACNESIETMKNFEKMFDKGGEFDVDVLTGFIRDSHAHPEFMKSLSTLINKANNAAKQYIQEQTTCFYQLYNRLMELVPDSHKSTPEHVSNLKVLFMSPRNREKSGALEVSLPQWNTFLEIMRNYAIIGEVRDEL